MVVGISLDNLEEGIEEHTIVEGIMEVAQEVQTLATGRVVVVAHHSHQLFR